MESRAEFAERERERLPLVVEREGMQTDIYTDNMLCVWFDEMQYCYFAEYYRSE